MLDVANVKSYCILLSKLLHLVVAGGSSCIEQPARFVVGFCCIQQGVCEMHLGG